MGTTTNYGWPYPELTDETDGASQMKALAQAADVSLKALATTVAAIPTGGGGGGPAPTDSVGGRFVNPTLQTIPVTASGPGTPLAFPSAGANTPTPTGVVSSAGGTIFTLSTGGVWHCGVSARIASAAAAGEVSLNLRADLAGG